jgi:phosphatidylglycerophosphate synthase
MLFRFFFLFYYNDDAFVIDGLVARKLNQTSTFGGLLDMVIDRCSTLG